ncbi:MAG: hypothetical protein QM626_14860 [Microbacterium sp.]|uniref:hypothetical protein n=1 Tax=Microbacterium sp. TaxID=51671 RepID=UPI0039E68DB5
MSTTILSARTGGPDTSRLEDARRAFRDAQTELARARQELLRLHSAHARTLGSH